MFQILSAYSLILLSAENIPAFAILTNDILFHFLLPAAAHASVHYGTDSAPVSMLNDQ